MDDRRVGVCFWQAFLPVRRDGSLAVGIRIVLRAAGQAA
jgi:hypothetical protein